MANTQRNIQVNITIPREWKTELENIARIISVEENRTVSFHELMRRGIQEKWQLGVDEMYDEPVDEEGD